MLIHLECENGITIERCKQQQSWISSILEWIVISMVIYFVVSIIQSMAQTYVKRLKDNKKKKAS